VASPFFVELALPASCGSGAGRGFCGAYLLWLFVGCISAYCVFLSWRAVGWSARARVRRSRTNFCKRTGAGLAGVGHRSMRVLSLVLGPRVPSGTTTISLPTDGPARRSRRGDGAAAERRWFTFAAGPTGLTTKKSPSPHDLSTHTALDIDRRQYSGPPSRRYCLRCHSSRVGVGGSGTTHSDWGAARRPGPD